MCVDNSRRLGRRLPQLRRMINDRAHYVILKTVYISQFYINYGRVIIAQLGLTSMEIPPDTQVLNIYELICLKITRIVFAPFGDVYILLNAQNVRFVWKTCIYCSGEPEQFIMLPRQEQYLKYFPFCVYRGTHHILYRAKMQNNVIIISSVVANVNHNTAVSIQG